MRVPSNGWGLIALTNTFPKIQDEISRVLLDNFTAEKLPLTCVFIIHHQCVYREQPLLPFTVKTHCTSYVPIVFTI